MHQMYRPMCVLMTAARITPLYTSHQARRPKSHVSRLAPSVVAHGTDNGIDVCFLRAAEKAVCIAWRLIQFGGRSGGEAQSRGPGSCETSPSSGMAGTGAGQKQ